MCVVVGILTDGIPARKFDRVSWISALLSGEKTVDRRFGIRYTGAHHMTTSDKKCGHSLSPIHTGKPPLDQVVRRTLTDEVLTTLRKAIIAGAFGPGDHVPEARMAEQLGVSRVPVREAMMALEREGLLMFDER